MSTQVAVTVVVNLIGTAKVALTGAARSTLALGAQKVENHEDIALSLLFHLPNHLLRLGRYTRSRRPGEATIGK